MFETLWVLTMVLTLEGIQIPAIFEFYQLADCEKIKQSIELLKPENVTNLSQCVLINE